MKILLLTGALLLLCACAPTKVLTEGDSRIKESIKTDVVTQVATREWLDKYLSERAFELQFRDVLFERVEYDTSKPVDSVTGKPPIKSETKITDKSVKESGNIKESQEVESSAVDSMVIDKSTVDTDVRSRVSVVEQKGLATIWRWLIGIGIVALLAGAVWLVKRVNL